MCFNNEKNHINFNLDKIKLFLNKYTILLITIIVLFIAIISFVNKKEIINYLDLNGEENVIIYQNSDYIEPGYKGYNSKNEDKTNEVLIKSNLNTSKIGEYEITYTIGNLTKIRKIKVITKPEEYTYIYLKTVNNNVNVYLKVGEKYEEPGYQVFSSGGQDLTSQVKVTGSVDTTKKGNYKLTYSVVDSNNVTISTSRTVIVMDMEINVTLTPEKYTNEKVKINIEIIDNYFDYLILPNKNKVEENTYSYEVSENGTYTFTFYNIKGIKKETNIEIKNIDKIAPTGSCIGYHKNGTSTISINASDNIGISKYVTDGITHTQNQITINKELEKVNVIIYDKAGNTKDINCTLEDKNEKSIFDKNITYSYEYVYKSNGVSYALYTPSTVKNSEKIPLIIWLHGSGSRGIPKKNFKKTGLIGIIRDWNLENFNAYILSPHISKETTSSWGSRNIKEKVYVILEEILNTKKIDTNKIILSGHSMGGIGVYDLANGKSDLFSAFVVMSGYNTKTDLTQYNKIPIKGYVGLPETGEDNSSYKHMINSFVKNFGQENLTIFETTHGKIPKTAFTQDLNNDNRSDLIEWMLNQ